MHDPAHSHEHDHSHGHSLQSGEKKEKLVLGYMLEHNMQHTAELAGLADKIEGAGDTKTAALVREAAKDYSAGNEKLHAALHNL